MQKYGGKKENMFNELSDLAKEISRQSVESAAWFLLLAKCERRDKLKEELLNWIKRSQDSLLLKFSRWQKMLKL